MIQILKVLIRKPFGNNQDKVQVAEIVIPHDGFQISKMVREILQEIDDPYRIYFSLSMLCLYGEKMLQKF